MKRVFALLAIIILFVWSIYTVFFSGYFTIANIIVVHDGTKIANSSLKEIFKPLIGENILFVSLHDKTRDLQEAHKHEFSNISVDRDFPGTIRISVAEFPQNANIVTTQGNVIKNFIINDQGMIVGEDVENSSLPYIRYMDDETEISKDMTLIPAERLAKTVLAERTFVDRFGMKVLEVHYYPVEREIHLLTERQFLVWIDMEQDVLAQLAKLKRSLTRLDIYSENLKYIDLRVAGSGGEKIIFKRK